MTRSTILAALFFTSFQSYYSQVNIIKDERIDSKVATKSQKQILGYRLQICFDSDKDLVDQARAKFIALYPKIDTYITFEAPNFNLKVGDFRTQIEAEKLKEKVGGEFTISIIHKELVNLPRIDQ